jgi:hypothetical protein
MISGSPTVPELVVVVASLVVVGFDVEVVGDASATVVVVATLSSRGHSTHTPTARPTTIRPVIHRPNISETNLRGGRRLVKGVG